MPEMLKKKCLKKINKINMLSFLKNKKQKKKQAIFFFFFFFSPDTKRRKSGRERKELNGRVRERKKY